MCTFFRQKGLNLRLIAGKNSKIQFSSICIGQIWYDIKFHYNRWMLRRQLYWTKKTFLTLSPANLTLAHLIYLNLYYLFKPFTSMFQLVLSASRGRASFTTPGASLQGRDYIFRYSLKNSLISCLRWNMPFNCSF